MRFVTCSFFFCIAGLIGGWTAATALSLAPPPLPPLGWEARTAPGFEPSIESVIIELSQYKDVLSETDVWKAWGAKAVDVLAALYEDDSWSNFGRPIRTLLLAEPSGPGKEYLLQRLIRLVSDPSLSVDHFEYNDLLYPLGPMLGNSALDLVHNSLQNFAASQDLSAEEKDLAKNHISLLRHVKTMEAEDYLERLAVEGNWDVREMCIRALVDKRKAESVTLARKLLEETEDDEMNKRLENLIRYHMPLLRAQEPMSIILEREKKRRR